MIRALLLLILGLVALPAWAAEVTVQLDSDDVRVGQTVGLRVVVVDAKEGRPPTFPDLDGLQITYQGTQQSTVMVNFRTTRTLTFNYALTALSDGDYAIRPAPVTVDGQRVMAPPVRLKVRARQSSESTSSDAIFGTLGTDSIWVGQVVVHHVEFRTRKRLLDVRWQAPTFEGFVPDSLAQAMQREYPVVEDGVNWSVIELDTPLQATSVGSREVPAGVLRAQFAITAEAARRRGFGLSRIAEARTEVFATEALPIQVRPLPTEGRTPAWSGLVGDFQAQAKLDRTQLKVGESATMTVVVSGDGSLAAFRLPGVADGQGFRVYDDEPEVQAEVRGGRYQAVGTWRRAVVPSEPGPLTLPPLEIQVFDPSTGGFRIVTTAPLTLDVLPGDGAEMTIADPLPAGADGRRVVEVVGEDILPIRPQARLRSQAFSPSHPGLLALIGLPVLALLGLMGRDGLRDRRPRQDPVGDLRRRLGAAEDQALGVAELEDLFREALGLALGQPAAGVDQAAAEAGLDGPLQAEVLALYRDLDRARYGGGDRVGLLRRVLAASQALLGEVAS